MDKHTREKFDLFPNGVQKLLLQECISILEDNGFSIKYTGNECKYSTIVYDKFYKRKFILRHPDICQAIIRVFINNKFKSNSEIDYNRFTYQFIGDKTDFSLGYKKYKNYKETEMLYYTKD